MTRQIDAIVLHCTATLAHMDFRAADIRAMHLRRGFSDIGYHWLIRLDGDVEQGRDEGVAGAHVAGFNARTIGVVYVGGLRSSDGKPKDTRNPAQIASMTQLLREIIARYPHAVILGHRDLSPDLDKDGKVEPQEWMKFCPCFDAGPWAESVGLPGGAYVNGKFVKL